MAYRPFGNCMSGHGSTTRMGVSPTGTHTSRATNSRPAELAGHHLEFLGDHDEKVHFRIANLAARPRVRCGRSSAASGVRAKKFGPPLPRRTHIPAGRAQRP